MASAVSSPVAILNPVLATSEWETVGTAVGGSDLQSVPALSPDHLDLADQSAWARRTQFRPFAARFRLPSFGHSFISATAPIGIGR